MKMKFCPSCYKVVRIEGQNCSNCGLQLMINDDRSHFLSGHSEPGSPVLNIASGEILMDRFNIKQLLGKGRYGSVYLAEDTLQSTEVALKAVGISLYGEDDTAIMQLKQELQAYNSIFDNRHILKVNDIHFTIFKSTAMLLLSMEYADGGSFREWLIAHQDDDKWEKRKTMGMEYFKQACLGVQAIHEAGLVHLDLKPENLLIQKKIIKISDFGLSRKIFKVGALSLEFTSDGMGTPSYMAPEQIMAARPKDVNYLADIYSLGSILFEILDGDPPYMGTPLEIFEKHRQGIKPDFDKIDENMIKILSKCLSTNPRDRYKKVSDILLVINDQPIKAETQVQWYTKKPELLHQLKEKLSSVGTIIEVLEDNGKSDLIFNLSCKYNNKRYPFKFVFPANYPNQMPQVFIRSQPLRAQLADKDLLTSNNEVKLDLFSDSGTDKEGNIESFINCLFKWMESVPTRIAKINQWYETNPVLLQTEIEKIKQLFVSDFRHDEINPHNQNMIFSIRINLNNRRFWMGLEFPEDYPNNIPIFFLKGDYVKEKLADIFVDGIINIHENTILNWNRTKDIKEMILSIIRIMKNLKIDEKLCES